MNRDLGKVEKDCRKAAPKEKQVGKTCESNPRARRESNVFNANYGVGHGGRVEWSRVESRGLAEEMERRSN